MSGHGAEVTAPASTDARKLRSRAALSAAFLRLLERKPLDQISIREIAAEANIGHATFYRHYPSKEALLDDLAADEISRLVELSLPVKSSTSTEAACHAICDYVYANRKLWTTLLTGGAASTVKEELLAISLEVAEDLGDGKRSSETGELMVILAVSSIHETLAWWLRAPKPLPPERVAGVLTSVLTLHEQLG